MSLDVGTTTQTLSDETLARRRYFREKQREYRRKLNADGAAMEAELVHLQSSLDSLQAKSLPSVREASDGPLSWRSIAMVFKSEAHRVLTDRESLITQTKGFRALIASMQRFVMMNIPVRVHLASLYESDPRTRNLGKEWLTQQLYHNMHDAFALLPAVRLDEEFFEFDFLSPDQHDDPFTVLERLQCILPGTLSSFRRFFETKVRDVLFEDPHEARDTDRQSSTFHLTFSVAALCGIDVTGIVDDVQKEAYVRRELIRLGNAHFLVWRQRFTALMQASYY
ncbi:hypothetical protein DYB31_013632 [Aphanomyces astaci]|uniref:Uncharacterized protein n=1 Tax=Aphanomyces astaci TaxID=112090 RepID=A0A397EXX6_APHAT|nr:hypothetical protein DYB31_013632 [Aphanomyces astaci]